MAEDKQLKLDPEMLEMFRSECKDNFDQAEESLLALEDDLENKQYLNTLFRALHTLKGVSNMMGFEKMGLLAHGAEELAGIFRDEGVPVALEGIDLILKAIDLLKEMAEQATSDGGYPDLTDEEILNEIRSLCQTLRQRDTACQDPPEGDAPISDTKSDEEETDAQPHMAESDDFDLNGQKKAENLNAFLFFIEEELPALKAHVEQALNNSDWQPAVQKVEVLEYAARDLGFMEISDSFARFRELLKEKAPGSNMIITSLEELDRACADIMSQARPDSATASQDEMAKNDAPGALSQDEALEAESTSCNHKDTSYEQTRLKDNLFEQGDCPDIDHEDLAAFLLFLEEEYPRLQQAISDASDTGQWHEVARCADMIEYAASQLGLSNLADTLKKIEELSLKDALADTSQVFELEKALVEELLALKQLGEKRGIYAGPSEKELSSIFINRVITDAEAMNGRLKECADAIEEGLELLRHDEDVEIPEDLFSHAVSALRILYHFCIFYGLETAAETILILEDIYNRMTHGEIPPNSQVTELTGQIAQLMQDVFEDTRQGKDVKGVSFDEVLSEARTFLSGFSENQVAGISKQFLNLLDISPGFSDVATPESNSKIAEAFKNGLFFYEIKVDLDSDPDVAGPFMDLGDRIEFITNETLYEGDSTKYNFLAASNLTEDEIDKVLAQIFPDKQSFFVRKCRPRQEIGILTPDIQTDGLEIERLRAAKDSGMSHETLTRLSRSVEEVAAICSTVHHVVNVLEQIDYEGLLTAMNMNERAQVNELLLQLRNLIQADRHLGSAIEELQGNVADIVTVPCNQLLDWMAHAAKNISGAKGLNVTIRIRKSNSRIARSLIRDLKKAIKPLLKACLDNMGARPGAEVTLGARDSGDSIFVDITTELELDRARAEQTIEEAKSLLGTPSATITFLGSGFAVRVANCNSLVHGIIMQKGGMNYVVPVQAIKRILEPSSEDITYSSCDNGHKIVKLEDKLVSVKSITGHGPAPEEEPEILVVVEGQSGLVAYEVDEIVGQEQLRVMPLSGHLNSISGAAGCTILGNGDVGIVLDVN